MHLTHTPRVALVTGAGRGIGKAIAERLASHGHTVLCVSKSDTCVQVANDILAKGQKAKAYQVDVSDAAAVAKACEQIVAEFGAVEILVNNAAAAIYQPLAEIPLRRRRLMFEVNVHAPLVSTT